MQVEKVYPFLILQFELTGMHENRKKTKQKKKNGEAVAGTIHHVKTSVDMRWM